LNTLAYFWFALTFLSTLFIAYDLFTRTPEMKVMKWGWLLVSLYTGPVAFIVYWFSCREPAPGTHEKFIAPLWKQGVGSAIHCLAGDASGIIFAAAITRGLGLSMNLELVVEYATGFLFGLFVFQALFMKDMLGGSYAGAVRKTIYAEWVSMNCVMAGMIPVMLLFMSRDMRAMEPTQIRFWFSMSVAALAGGIVAIPVNVWLVAKRLKHGMGTDRALGAGGARTTAALPEGHAMAGMSEDSAGLIPSVADSASQAMGHKATTVSPIEKSLVAAATIALLLFGVASGERALRTKQHETRPAGMQMSTP
jgi:hypothetical protein